ncbi:hypothetical protein [Spirosoma rigui]|uniref:hypothetical protein n=1 Tax=Spirosoma rigui TaxID=564064 RepID=UPI0009B17BCB|nr:hypothetical protein [Spirosoma rigui]
MNILLVKITLMPLVIGLITVISRKWGYKVGGLVASMPWIAGPILLFFILEQGTAFGIRSVPGILTGIISLISFCYCYAQLSKHFNWLITILTSYLVYVLVALLFDLFKFNLFVVYGITLMCVVVALYFFPVPTAHQPPAKRLPFDMLIRMVVATLFVILITGLATVLGPTWSGILTPFPIITSILAIFTHYLQGNNATVTVLRGLVSGLFGFTTFLFLQAFLLQAFSVGISFLLALLVNLVINYIVSRMW